MDRAAVWAAIDGGRLELGHGQGEGDAASGCWRQRRDAEGVLWLLLDQPDASANRIDEAMLEELDLILAEIERAPPKGVVIRSVKRSGFIAGADLAIFRATSDARAVEAKVRRAHAVVDRLAALSAPTVAVIHGFCLGGGLELALACRHRIALAGASLGFPEIHLGLHPGLGGTARLTRLIDPLDAMTMMLTGRPKHARAARRSGLVDVVTEERHVAAAVRAVLAGTHAPRRPGWRRAILATTLVRRLAAHRMHKETRRRAPAEHYPAPYALIDLWEAHGGNPAALQAAEVSSFARLLVGPTAQNLVRLFFLREKLKAGAKGAHDIAHVHVVGAGAMGGDIAAWCALRGLGVSLADTNLRALGGAMRRAAALFQRRAGGRIAARDAMDRLVPDPKGAGVARADLVIEAVPENLDLKREIHAALEARMKEGAILATNTSSLRLEDLRAGLRRPERFIGLHFFNPVAQMQLVEVVSHDEAAPETLDAARAFTVAIDRLPALVRSAPGFLVNRALTPYLLEALVLLDEKIAPETIDAAAEGFGMPMGPIALADQVGLDVCLEVARVLRHGLPQSFAEVPAAIEQKVERGELGRKTGKGLYTYKNGKPQKRARPAAPDGEIADRLILPLVNACVACLREGVAADEETVDAALVLGAGFAPFRGGPLRYARTRGVAETVAALERLATRHGERFAPDAGWAAL
jgi:3-hydroxyacyl-CoA dehydrogenase/enoyl-CoA hydratase/3-hydroxybutyryl-CoA epimerase